jgi:N-acetyl-anhydromuramyl-L-alanine amidase AmpD
MGELIIAGKAFSIDAPIRNMYETGWDATKPFCVPMHPGARTECTGPTPFGEKAKNRSVNRFSVRPALRRYGLNPPLAAVQSVIRHFVLHHDGLFNSAICWHVLHNERGLSCHFLVDNDGTIYQTLDLALCAFHASEFNPTSIGVELCNRGDAKKEPYYYADKKRFPEKRDPTPCTVHGSKILAFDFTPQQYDAMQALARGLAKLLPNLPIEYPQSAPGVQAWGLIPNPMSFSGYIGHYHITTRKWDPGPFDFKKFCEKLRGSLCFPLWTGVKDPSPTEKPVIPENLDELLRRTEAFYEANERRADGGFFPVGPWGDARLWHGGVHVPAPAGQPVFAPFPGRVVAARFGTKTSTGSQDFVLVRHDMSIGPKAFRFFTLFMHLQDELADKAPAPPWMAKDGWRQAAAKAPRGSVVLLDEPVGAGEVLGRVGKAGPVVDGDDLSRSQVHFEVFATEEVFASFDASPWTVIDGSEGGRFCDEQEINGLVDTDPADGLLSRRELLDFFTGSGDRQGLRFLVTYNVSEWTATPDWKEALRVPADFRAMKPEDIDAMVDEQILPGLWWEQVARHAHLPADGVVYHYHPVTFVRWINEKILESAADPANQLAPVDPSETQEVTGMTTDLEEAADSSDMVSDADLGDDSADKAIQLEHLVEGYAGDPEVAP